MSLLLPPVKPAVPLTVRQMLPCAVWTDSVDEEHVGCHMHVNEKYPDSEKACL